MKKRVAALVAFAVVAACQDHHFVPIENADKIKLPSGKSALPSGFPETAPAQKQVMAEAGKTPPSGPYAAGAVPPAGGLIVQGRLELGKEQMKTDFAGWTIYVLVKSAESAGPPLAVVRLAAGKFPMEFTVDQTNLMGGGFPAPGQKLIVEARLDRDGDPMTKVAGDVFGFTQRPAVTGEKNVNVVLDQVRK